MRALLTKADELACSPDGDRASRIAVRDALALRLLYFSGAQSSEIIQLCWRDVDHAPDAAGEPQYRFRFANGSKKRTVTIRVRSLSPLERHRGAEQALGYGADHHPVFRSSKRRAGAGVCSISRVQLYRVAGRVSEQAGLAVRLGPRDLRRAHVAHASTNGAPAAVIMRSLGLSSYARATEYLGSYGGENSSEDFLSQRL